MKKFLIKILTNRKLLSKNKPSKDIVVTLYRHSNDFQDPKSPNTIQKI